jgi:hypothetical protein
LPARLQLALDACRAVRGSLTGEVCYRWIGADFKARGVTYRDLAALACRGCLRRTGKGRHAVYYRLVRPGGEPRLRDPRQLVD